MEGLRPFFCYYGGKWRSAKRYPFPEYSRIIEPFAGSAGYSLRHYEKNVILIEKDEIVFGVWKYLQGSSFRDIINLPNIDFDKTVNDYNICQEAKWLIGFWLYKGRSSPYTKPGAWMKSGKRPNSYWGVSIKKRIARQLKYISHWEIYLGDYRSNVFGNTCTWFIDPPYQSGGQAYRKNKVDYENLSHWCKSRPGQVIVCEKYGADWLPFKEFNTIKTSPGKGRRGFTKEVIWTNEV